MEIKKFFTHIVKPLNSGHSRSPKFCPLFGGQLYRPCAISLVISFAIVTAEVKIELIFTSIDEIK